MTFQEAWSELMSYVPQMNVGLAQRLVQRAWRDIRDQRHWSFLVRETTLDAPDQISTGTVVLTQNSALVTGSAAAFAVWDAVTSASFLQRQFRAGTAGPIYNILSYTSPTITLDRPYAEASAATSTYSIYQCYFEPPADFARWTSVIDPVNAYPLKTDVARSELDLRDPQRGALGQPYVLASYKYDTVEDAHLFELYPHPTSQRSYRALYQAKGLDLTSAQSINPMIPDDLLMERAKYRAYEWAAANASAHPNLANVQWAYLRSQSKKDYQELMAKTQKIDEEVFLQDRLEPYVNDHIYLGAGETFMMSHAPWYGWGRW